MLGCSSRAVARRFGEESLQVGFARQTTAKDHLDGDDSIKTDLSGAKDDSHATATDLFDQLVVAERRGQA